MQKRIDTSKYMQKRIDTSKFFRTLAVMTLSCFLAGCGGNAAKDTAAQPQNTIGAVASMQYETVTDLRVSVYDGTISLLITTGTDYIADPLQIRTETSSSVDGFEGFGNISYVAEENGGCVLYSGLDTGSDIFWQRHEIGGRDSLTRNNAEASLNLYLACMDSFEAGGEEVILDRNTVRYDGVISGNILQEAIETSGVISQLEHIEFTDMADLVARNVGELPVSIWIEKDTDLPIRYELDMTAAIQSLQSRLRDGEGDEYGSDSGLEKMTVTMTVQSINETVSIEIPEEARNAAANPASVTYVEEELTDENYRSYFLPAQDLGYQYVGRAYCKAPDGMFGKDKFLDAYLPYGGDLSYAEDGMSLWSSAHGMQVLQSTAYAEDNARSVVDQAYQEFLDSHPEMAEEGTGGTIYNESFDIAYRQIAYYEETDEGKQPRTAILYADHKQGNYYLYARITYMPEQFDDLYPALLEELRDAFSLALPQYAPEDFY